METKKGTQYLGALAACMSAMAVGTTMSWTSAAEGELTNEKNNFHIDKTEFSWVGAFLSVGAVVGAIPLGFLANVIGRKKVLIGLAPFMTLGFVLLACANALWMLYLGRVILGAVVGAYCVVAPMYTGEISESSIRGVLGSYFQLLITAGILFIYVLDACGVGLLAVNIACACIPIIMAIMVSFLPDTPSWCLSKNNTEGARKSLEFFRGSGYNVQKELAVIQDGIDKQRLEKVPFSQAFSSKAAKKGMFLALSVMLFQQFSGINAVIFYASNILGGTDKGSSTSKYAVAGVGVCQIFATYLSTLLIDRLGRRPLLILSGSVMALSAAILGLHFYLVSTGVNVGWLPILCLVVFVIVFSLGFGPIPWLYMSEVFSDEIKETAMSIATVVNWIAVFIVTKFYSDMENSIQTYGAFRVFSAVSAIGCVFTFFFVVETRGRDISSIVAELSGESNLNPHSESGPDRLPGSVDHI